MVDTPITPPIAPPAAPLVTNTPPVAPIEATLTSVPDKIQQLIRQIQVNATVTQLPGDGTAILNSIIGPLTILLPQLADAQQQKLLQQLTNLVQTQRPLTVVVQPGDPPTQAFLFLPPTPASTQATAPAPQVTNPVDAALNQAVAQPPRLPVTPGTILPAIVLPPNVSVPVTPASIAQPPVPVYIPTTSAPAIGQPPVPAYIPTANAPAASSELAQATAALSAFANDLAPELVNTPAFQELAAKVEVTAEQTPLPTQPSIQPNILAPNTTSPLAPNTAPTLVANTAPLLIPNTSPTTVTLPSSVATQSVPQPTLLTTMPNAPLQNLTAPLPSVQNTATPTNLAALPQPSSSAVTLLQLAGNEVSLQVDAVIPPPISTAAPSLPLPVPGPNQILATVTSAGPSGQILLQANDVTLYIKQSVDAPVGTTLLLTVEPAKAPTLQVLTAPDAPNFANLQSVLSNLAQINPQVAQQVLANHIPQATMALPGALLFFLSAIKQSNVRTWLGDDAVDALTRAGKFELINKLAQDLAKMGESASDPVVGEWKSYPIPLQTNNQFQVLNFYVHADGGGNNNSFEAIDPAKKMHTRFLIDVRMSQLGPMQLDGFIQPKKLDIIVRSEHRLPEGLHNELRQVYTKALTGIDYAGSLNFQVGRNHWLIIQNAKAQAAITT